MIVGSSLGVPLHAALTSATLAVFLLACWCAPWKSWLIGHPDRQHVWLGTLVVILLMGAVRPGVASGLLPQFLLVTTFTLMHGWLLAIVGIGVVLAVNCFQHGNWADWPAYFLCEAAVPALFVHWLHLVVVRRLPRNFWIFIFVTAFAGSIAAFALAALVLVMVARSWPVGISVGDYLVVLGLMGFAEAYVDGLLMSATVVYKPDWVATFDDRLYFAR